MVKVQKKVAEKARFKDDLGGVRVVAGVDQAFDDDTAVLHRAFPLQQRLFPKGRSTSMYSQSTSTSNAIPTA